MKYYCGSCNDSLDSVKLPRCSKCGNVYELHYEYGNNFFKKISQPVTHWKYIDFMPVDYSNIKKIFTMGEGGTPLSEFTKLNIKKNSTLYFKCEYMNPTGSFKDRASALEITLAQGKNEIVTATTGNMGASLAAYSALADIKCTIFMPKSINNAKIEQMKMYGANIIPVTGDYTNAMIKSEQYYLKHSNSYLAGDYGVRIEGTKSVGFEICDQLSWGVPDYIVVPVGNGTLLYAIYKSFLDLLDIGIIKTTPRIIAVKSNDPKNTIASAIACPKPSLEFLINENATRIITVSDTEIMTARAVLAKNGLFVEPGGAVAYAGYQKLDIEGTIIVLLTGSGLKGI